MPQKKAIVTFILQFLFCYSMPFTILVANDMHTLDYPPSDTYCSQEGNAHFCSNNYHTSLYKYGNITNNPPISLTRILVENMKKNTPEPNLLVLLGDFPAHEYANDIESSKKGNFRVWKYQSLRNMINNVANEFKAHFPTTITLPAFGNNDFKYNYQVPKFTEKKEYYKFLFNTFFETHDENSQLPQLDEIRETFLSGGYYKIDFEGSLRVIVLNTLYFATANQENRDPKTAAAQIKWFEQKMKEAKENNMQIVLIYHILPGFCYTRTLVINLKEKYSQIFETILRKYRKSIAFIISGHTHASSFRMATFLKKKIKKNGKNKKGFYANTFISPAISPVYKNNPGYSTFYLEKKNDKYFGKELIYTHFDLYKYNQQEEFSNFEVEIDETPFFFDYSFTKTYGVSDLSAKSVKKALRKVEKNIAFFKEHLMWTLGVKNKEFFEKAAALSIARFGLVKKNRKNGNNTWENWYVNMKEKCKYFCVMREIINRKFEKCVRKCEQLWKNK